MKIPRRWIREVASVAAVLCFCSGLLWRCASIITAEGGPRDSLPPRVIYAWPDNRVTGFKAKRIEINFDEYVSLKDQQKEFFTSPRMRKNPQLTMRGRTLLIDLKDSLAPNTTYALDFGNSITDNNEGNPLSGFRYVFSTGEQVDSLVMSGYTVDGYSGDSVSRTLIYFFDPSAADSIPQITRLLLGDDSLPDFPTMFDTAVLRPRLDSTLFRAEPLAIGRARNNGIFLAENLKPIPYLIYAVEDNNGNFSYEPGSDRVGFLDSLVNPVSLPGFAAWYDTTRKYVVADPQVSFRMFMEQPFRRQNLSESRRPQQHKIELLFGAPHPRIDTLRLDGIDSTQIVTEYPTPGRDTIYLWLNVPSDSLPDTIRGRIVYHKHDSINRLQPAGVDLKLAWKYFESKEERREREREERERAKAEADSVEYVPKPKKNPFGYKTTASGEVNPEKNVSFTFDYPLVEMDSAALSLIRLGEDKKRYRVRYRIDPDTADLHGWIVSAAWQPGEKYSLTAPAGMFRDVAGQVNDTIRAEFTIADPEKYASIVLHVTGKTPDSRYIVELLDESGRQVLQQKTRVTTGTYTFNYIKPGNVQIKVIEDDNGNGRWDGGDLLRRVQPERVEMFTTATGDELLPTKANWELSYDLDMNRLFAPVTMERLVEQLRKAEAIRLQRLAEEREKRRQEEMQSAYQHNGSSSSNSGMNNSYNNRNGMGSGSFGGGFGGLGGGMRPANNYQMAR